MSASSNYGGLLIKFSLDNLPPALTSSWLYANIFLAYANSSFNTQMVDFIFWFYNSKLFSCVLVTGTQFFGRDNARFPMYFLTSPTVGQPEIFLHNLPFFNTSSDANLSISLLTRVSLYQYPTRKRIFSPLEIST